MLRGWTVFNKIPTEQLIRVKHIHVFEGGRSALYITSGDIVYGLGNNGCYNLLGLSGRQRSFSLLIEPVNVERLSLKSISTIAVGDHFGVAVSASGELFHWGRRMDRRRGILLPHQVKCVHFVVDIACGSEFFVILTKEQKVFFRGAFQQNDRPILDFIEVSLGLAMHSISCGIYHVSMLTTEGEIYNCGYDHRATYKTWNPDEGIVAKKLQTSEKCVKVVCGRRSTVFLLSSGSLWACGENDYLGVSSDNSVMKIPAHIHIEKPIREIAATWFSNIYAASTWTGEVYHWGHRVRKPTLIKDACDLIDAFRDKETPSTLGTVPVAPQLSPGSSFNAKTAPKRPTSLSLDVVMRLERSLSADDLTSSKNYHRETPKLTAKLEYKPSFSQNPSTKPLKNIPGIGLLITAGKYLATRPVDRQQHNGHQRRRAVSPENHPKKVAKLATLSVAQNEWTYFTKDQFRSHSMENLDVDTENVPNRKKPRVLSMIFGRNLDLEKPKTPPSTPEKDEPNCKPSSPKPNHKFDSKNPFIQVNADSIYPNIPPVVEDPPTPSCPLKTNSIAQPTQTNPFLYDPMNCITFQFPPDAKKCFEEKTAPKTPENPSKVSLLKYYDLLADIKSDVKDLQKMINDLADSLLDL